MFTYKHAFYDGTPGRTLATCPRCQHPADASLGGDHGGDCPLYKRPVDLGRRTRKGNDGY